MLIQDEDITLEAISQEPELNENRDKTSIKSPPKQSLVDKWLVDNLEVMSGAKHCTPKDDILGRKPQNRNRKKHNEFAELVERSHKYFYHVAAIPLYTTRNRKELRYETTR